MFLDSFHFLFSFRVFPQFELSIFYLLKTQAPHMVFWQFFCQKPMALSAGLTPPSPAVMFFVRHSPHCTADTYFPPPKIFNKNGNTRRPLRSHLRSVLTRPSECFRSSSESICAAASMRSSRVSLSSTWVRICLPRK